MFRALRANFGRWRVEAPTPHVGLFLAVAFGGLDLVESLERPVMAFVEAPVSLDWQPRLAHGLEGKVLGNDGSDEERGMAYVESESLLGHSDASAGCLLAALIGEFDVMPTGEQVQAVPFALAVSKDHEGSGHVAIVGRPLVL